MDAKVYRGRYRFLCTRSEGKDAFRQDVRQTRPATGQNLMLAMKDATDSVPSLIRGAIVLEAR